MVVKQALPWSYDLTGLQLGQEHRLMHASSVCCYSVIDNDAQVYACIFFESDININVNVQEANCSNIPVHACAGVQA